MHDVPQIWGSSWFVSKFWNHKNHPMVQWFIIIVYFLTVRLTHRPVKRCSLGPRGLKVACRTPLAPHLWRWKGAKWLTEPSYQHYQHQAAPGSDPISTTGPVVSGMGCWAREKNTKRRSQGATASGVMGDDGRWFTTGDLTLPGLTTGWIMLNLVVKHHFDAAIYRHPISWDDPPRIGEHPLFFWGRKA